MLPTYTCKSLNSLDGMSIVEWMVLQWTVTQTSSDCGLGIKLDMLIRSDWQRKMMSLHPGLPDGVHKAVRISKCSHVVAADILSGRSPWDYQGKSRSGGLGRGYFVVGKVWDPVMILSSWQQAFASLVWFSWILERKTSAFGWALGFPCVSQIFRCAAQEIHDLQL